MLTFLKRIMNKLFVLITIILLWIFSSPTHNFQLFSMEPSEEQEERVEKKKIRGEKGTLEKIISFPGAALYFPVKMTMIGIGETVGYVHATKIPAKIEDFLTSDDGLRGLLPTYSARNGAGLNFYNKELTNRENELNLTASVGLHNRQLYQFDMEKVQIIENVLFADYSMGYNYLPDEPFYGPGKDSRKKDETNYGFQRAFVKLGVQPVTSRRFDIKAQFSYENINAFSGQNSSITSISETYNSCCLPGLSDQIDLVSSVLQLQFDTRDNEGGPRSGQYLILDGGIYSQLENNDYEFLKITADIRQYFHLFYNRTIQLRFAAQGVKATQDKKIPFYYLSELGEQNTIRGFERGRYRDRYLILASIEYRYPVWRRLEKTMDAFLFFDAGQVANDFEKEVALPNMKYGYGIGFRLWDIGNESIRIAVSRSEEQIRFYFTLN